MLNPDEPVIRPSPGRFYIDPRQQGDLNYVYDHLRAPCRTTADLVLRACAYAACTPKATDAQPDMTAESHRLFEALLDLAGCQYRTSAGANVLQTGGQSVHEVMLDDDWTAFDAAAGAYLGLGVDDRPVGAEGLKEPDQDVSFMKVKDRVWGGMPFKGLTLKFSAVGVWTRT